MKNLDSFKSFFYGEALASHGGYWLQRDQPSLGQAASGKDLKWAFPDYSQASFAGSDLENERQARKSYEKLTKNYKFVIDKLDEKLARLGDYNFHIYFGLPENIKSLLGTKIGDSENISGILDDYFFGSDGMNIPRSDIVFIKTGPSGDPLTPWMVLHTIGHALTSGREGSTLKHSMHQTMNMLEDYYKNLSYHTNPKTRCLYNFRSARILDGKKFGKYFGGVESSEELKHELIAAYLWYGGKIKRPSEKCMETLADRMYLDGKISGNSKEFYMQKTQEMVEKFYNSIEQSIKEALDKTRGTVLMDIFPYIGDLKD